MNPTPDQPPNNHNGQLTAVAAALLKAAYLKGYKDAQNGQPADEHAALALTPST